MCTYTGDLASISIQVSIIYVKYGQQTATQGATADESRKCKGNVTTQKNEESKKKYCTSKPMCNEVGVTGWISNGSE